MADLTQEQIRAEAERRVRSALQHIEHAQAELDRACADLSNLERGAALWRSLGKLYDQVHAAWYRVEEFRQRGRFTLDSIARDALAKRLAATTPNTDPRD